MIVDLSKVAVYIRPGPCDMRKAINGLSVIVAETMELDAVSGNLFLFCNKQRRILKCLYWDRNGFCLWLVADVVRCSPMQPGQKRLERDRFPWPQTSEAAREITVDELKMLLSGIDFFRAHRELKYCAVV